MSKFSILITTYNRKERLLQMLKSIEEQGLFDRYSILISDNCSDYDVEGVIKESFSEGFSSIITVHRWNFNIGMSSNISVSMALVESDWCLFLSDDDELMPNAISKILSDIDSNPNAIALKYSINKDKPYPDGKFDTLDSMIDYYESNHEKVGEAYFLTQVYNLKLLKPHLGLFTTYSYTYASFMVVLMFALRDSLGYIVTSSFQLIHYKAAAKGDGWTAGFSVVKTFLGITTLQDVFINNHDFKRKDDILRFMFRFLQLGTTAGVARRNLDGSEPYRVFSRVYKAARYSSYLYKILPTRIAYYLFVIRFKLIHGK